jgi:hypothetical protein
MFNDLPIQYRPDEMELDAYNAAFYELGFRWHWDRNTYEGLSGTSRSPAERMRRYLETQQPHLLRAYDAEFLVAMIESRKVECRKRRADSDSADVRPLDWSQIIGAEIGA